MSGPLIERPSGIPGSELSGPFAVGVYAAKLRGWLRERARVQLFGEVWNMRVTPSRVWFELRDATGALPCAMWRTDFDALGLGDGALADGSAVVVAGGPDFYPGSRTASPSFSFAVTALRIAGEGDLLAQLDRLRKLLDAEGLFAPQKRLARPPLPRSIGVVCAQGGKARDDVVAGLLRRGWRGRVVWAFAPVQDRHAAPRVTSVLQDLAATGAVDVIIVARGGGSLADLFCFCDETLCRTVAMLPVPVIASVGHHTDRTLLDDVAAVSCSTPTHAAEAAVQFDVLAARRSLHAASSRLQRHARRAAAERPATAALAARLRRHASVAAAARPSTAALAARLERHARRAVVERARTLAALSRAPMDHVRREQERLHQQLREIRAATVRRVALERSHTGRRALVLRRKGDASAVTRADRRRDLDRLLLALAAHDPQRTLERGYALVETPAGDTVTTAGTARAAGAVRLRFADGTVDATTRTSDPTLFEEH